MLLLMHRTDCHFGKAKPMTLNTSFSKFFQVSLIFHDKTNGLYYKTITIVIMTIISIISDATIWSVIYDRN